MLRFLLCGGSATAVDFATYYLFLEMVSPSPAKAMSFICGAVVAYFANKYFTFGVRERSFGEPVRFVLLYGVTFFVNVAGNKLALFVFEQTLAAFLIATFITMVCNFIGQKFFVFRK